jgi:hypothetical protein
MSRLPEVQAAADWWGDQLAQPGQQDTGDAFNSGFATALMLTVVMRTPMTADERALFVERLATRIEAHLVATPDWERATGEPNWGSAYRVLGVDYGPDLMLASALIAAVGQTRADALSLLWPVKTHMWINPGEVKVAHGYRAEPVVIYPAKADGQ